MADSKRRTVLFDLDGTLTDSFVGIAHGIQHALEAIHRPVPPTTELRWCVGPPLREVFQKLVGVNGPVERAIDIYRTHYGASGLFENRVYDGVPEMLEHAHTTARLCICTSKRRLFAERIAQHFGLARFFDGIFGSDDDGRFENKSELVREILESEKLDPSYVVLVGDREHDVRAALANDIMPIGVTYGYGSRSELIAAGANVICDSPADVTKALDADT